MMLFVVFGFIYSAAVADPASEQLFQFVNDTEGLIGFMTTSNGVRVEINDTSVLTSTLVTNEYYMDTITHFVRQKIPERAAHPKGAGAFGFFQVTHNVTDICKATFLSEIGKETPVTVRFSATALDKGGSDTVTTPLGFATKFYTEDGNFDAVKFSIPMSPVKDPLLFPSIDRSFKRNPATNLHDFNAQWDFLTLRPETIFFFMYLYAGYGNPYSYRHMAGYSIHTYQIYNKNGESYFARFHFNPDLGVKNLNLEEISKIVDPDYLVRDLYNAIEMGEFPSWTVSLQVLTIEDVKNANFDVFDVTKLLPLEQYPLRPVGKLILNRNPKNYFADVEQLAYGPYNLVPGILGSPDKMFEARRLAYRDAHLYRLGVNFNKIAVNCPISKVLSYNRDGVPNVDSNGGNAPNYFPNSFNGPYPDINEIRPNLISVTHDYSNNFDQAADLYVNVLNDEQKNMMIFNIVKTLKLTHKSIQKRAIQIFSKIHEDFGSKVSARLAKT